jgi:hypothetical protein
MDIFVKKNLVLKKRNDSKMTERFRNSRTVLKKTHALSERHVVL